MVFINLTHDSQLFFQNQFLGKNTSFFDVSSKGICKDILPTDKCKEMKEFCPHKNFYTNCKKTCGKCAALPTCKNILPSQVCQTTESMCTNSIFKNYCRKTCTKCDNDDCVDIYPEKTCEKFKDRCYKPYYAEKCMKTCDSCPEVCKDFWNNKTCKKHKKKKKCDLDDVATNCQKTCKLCTKPVTGETFINSCHLQC